MFVKLVPIFENKAERPLGKVQKYGRHGSSRYINHGQKQKEVFPFVKLKKLKENMIKLCLEKTYFD